MPGCLSPLDAKELISLCKAGRLYEVEAWIRAGHPVAVPPEVRRTPLEVALDTGFHSLVKLLLRHEKSQEAKNDVLAHALLWNKRAFIELAIEYGAAPKSVPFLDVLTAGDRALAALFLERGADPVADHPFAKAFHKLRAKTTIGSYLDCRRGRPDLAEDLQRQADMALRQFALEGNLKWVSLLMWAGADPRSRGTTIEDAEDAEWSTTALLEASGSDSIAVLKKLGPTRSDDLAGMVERAAFRAQADMLDFLLILGASPNDKPDGGSSALDRCLEVLGWEELNRVERGDVVIYEVPSEKPSRGRKAVRVLLRHGALWSPDPSTLNKTRRILYKLEPDTLVELIGQLRARAGVERVLQELLRVTQMRRFVSFCERQLADQRDRADRKQLGRTDEATTPPSRIFRREDRWRLYDAVWSKPVAKAARRLGVSVIRLKQACSQLEIPTPPRGYWAKKKAGQPVARRPRLRELAGSLPRG
jgi:hypothetical protein